MGVLLFVVSLMPPEEAGAPVFLMLGAFTAIMAPLLVFVARRSSRLLWQAVTPNSTLGKCCLQ